MGFTSLSDKNIISIAHLSVGGNQMLTIPEKYAIIKPETT
jgi:hypothetical protein